MRRPEEVFVFVRRGAEFLVLHRSPRQGSYWHCVAGALEPGESFPEAAARELCEETGLVAQPTDLDRTFAYPLSEEPERAADFEPGTEEVVVRSFAVEAQPGWEPVLDWEHDEYRWCSADEAAGLFRWPEPAEIVQDLGTRATTGSPVPRPTCRQATGKTVTSPSQLPADSRTDR